LHQKNPPVLNWGCRLMKVDLYNGRKTVVVAAVSKTITKMHIIYWNFLSFMTNTKTLQWTIWCTRI